jgi:hypothetical protein
LARGLQPSVTREQLRLHHLRLHLHLHLHQQRSLHQHQHQHQHQHLPQHQQLPPPQLLRQWQRCRLLVRVLGAEELEVRCCRQ